MRSTLAKLAMGCGSALFAAALLLPVASAQPQTTSVTFEAAASSKHVFRGLQLGKETFNPSFEFSRGALYGGAWGAIPLRSRDSLPGLGERYELYLGHGWAVAPRVALDLGFKRHERAGGVDSNEIYIGAALEQGTVSPSLYLHHDFDLDTTAFEMAADFAVPVQGFPFDFRIFAGAVDRHRMGDYIYYGADARYPFELGDRAKGALGLHYADRDTGLGLSRPGLFGSASVSIGF